MSDGVTIRRMTEADLGRVYALEKVSHPVPWSQASLQRSFADHHSFVLIKQQQIVGFAFVQKILDEAHLLDIVIDPVQRGHGLGRYFLRELIEREFCDGINIWFLEVRASNEAAIALYQSLDFNELGVRRNYYDTPTGREDAVMMAYTVS
ncbi:MAG: ribosomal protein S18-alanine N-acetyltransferase [Moraxellaceae bacterium]|nr:ribosomal protein S18-alanine N-acetyltransferase [Moraxellaceae bacterium]MDP1775422.1 ribosomal protein S18-alanine N-acetyltransferase [Moraxellaceae bacterium]